MQSGSACSWKGKRCGEGNNSRSLDINSSVNALGNTGQQNACQYTKSAGDAGSSTEPATARRWTRVLYVLQLQNSEEWAAGRPWHIRPSLSSVLRVSKMGELIMP